MPGLIGRAYHQMGGKVHYVGKPFPAVYADCFRALREVSVEIIEKHNGVTSPQMCACGMYKHLRLCNERIICFFVTLGVQLACRPSFPKAVSRHKGWDTSEDIGQALSICF